MLPFRILLASLALFLLPALTQAQALDLYEGEAPVSGQGEGERNAALPAAMGQMLVRLTGDPDIGFDPSVRQLLSDAPRMLQRFRYRQQTEVRDGLPQSRSYLVARFDPAQVDTALAASGVAVWLPPRPQPLVWLAIDDGSGPRLLGAAQSGVVVALSQRAAQRGLVLRYPDADEEEAALVGSVLGGRLDTLQSASERYGEFTLLLGRLQREASGWRVHWSAVERGESIDARSASSADSGELLALGADVLADALARRYRIVAGGEVERVRVSVRGLAPPDDYARVMAYLQRLPGVQRVSPSLARGDSLELELDVAGGLAQLERLVALGRLLQFSGSGQFDLRR